NDISFSVAKGEILGFLGPNGAGKTTTMRVLTGYLPATSGTARVAGYDVADQSIEVRRHIGYLPETPPLYPEMSVHAYLEFVARIKKVLPGDVGRRVDQAMAMTNLAEKRNELIKRLSRGFKQRVGLAQAIVHNPDVVILDEPTVGLDPKQIIEVRKLIKGLAGEHTIILSTHILPEVSMTCDRVVIINKGRIAAVDTPTNLTNQLKGAERIQLEVGADPDSLRSTLMQIDGVSAVKIEEAESPDRLAVTVESQAEGDIRSLIAKRLIGEGFDLYELRAIRLTLEDIFLQLTTEEQQAAPEAAAAEAAAEAAV